MSKLLTFILLLFCLSISLHAQSLGEFVIKIEDNVGTRIGAPDTYSIVISTAVTDLKIKIESSTVAEPIIKKDPYDTELKEYFVVVKPLTGSQKYTVLLLHDKYRTGEIKLSGEDFKGGSVKLNVDGILSEDSRQTVRKRTPEELYNAALKYYNEENYVRALLLFQRAAEQGHGYSQYYLGLIYENGKGDIGKNVEEAKKWYRKAASQNNELAKIALNSLERETASKNQSRKYYRTNPLEPLKRGFNMNVLSQFMSQGTFGYDFNWNRSYFQLGFGFIMSNVFCEESGLDITDLSYKYKDYFEQELVPEKFFT